MNRFHKLFLSICFVMTGIGSTGVLLLLQSEQAAAQSAPIVWPLHKSTTPDYVINSRHRLSSTFGPRLKSSEQGLYDWHRGIDIPADCYTPVYAIADGKVMKAGDYPGVYEDRMVQVRHTKPGGGYIYSNYMHLASVPQTLMVNSDITQGTLIGYTGESNIGYSGVCTTGYAPQNGNGFDHLHFEISDGGQYQKQATHPLNFLPYADTSAPTMTISNVVATDPLHPQVTVKVEVNRNEVDLNRVEVTVYNNEGGVMTQVDQKVFDIIDWTLQYSTFGTTSDVTVLDTAPVYDGVYDADYNNDGILDGGNAKPTGVIVMPAAFHASSRNYQITLTFFILNGVANVNDLVIKVKAIDIYGHYSEDISIASAPATTTLSAETQAIRGYLPLVSR